MARRLLSAVARTLRPATPNPTARHTDDVHFHNETGRPTPCFDDVCPRPKF